MSKERETIELRGEHGQFVAYADDLITNQIKQFGAHTRNEIAMVLDHLNEGAICIDIGAHIGTFTVPLAQKVGPKGRLLALEGSEDTYKLLAKNVEINELEDRVVTQRCIAADGIPRNLTRKDTFGNTGAGFYAPDEQADLIATDNTADLIERHGFIKPDFIKMDIEGMEAIVLRNMASVIEANRPILYIEISTSQLARFDDTPKMIENQLKDLGYRFYRNIGQRNSSNDSFEAKEIESLVCEGQLFDLLALP